MDDQDEVRKTIQFYDDHVEEYMEHTLGLIGKYSVEWREKFLTQSTPRGKILDAGCAFGRDCKYFVEQGFETYGVDLSEKLIEKAKEYEPKARFSVENVLDLSFEDSTFDGIWCSAVLLHISKKNVPQALAEMHRVLKTEGTLYLCLKEGQGEELKPDDRYEGSPEKFYVYFEEAEIRELLEEAGFSIQESTIEHREEAYLTKPLIRVLARKYAQ